MMYFSRLKTAVILGVCLLGAISLHPQPIPRPGRLDALAHRSSWT